MKAYVITDNVYTLVGMKIAGVEGDLVDSTHSFKSIFNPVTTNDKIGVVMIAPKLITANQELVNKVRFNQTVPVIVEIPGPDEYKDDQNKITETIQKAVNISV